MDTDRETSTIVATLQAMLTGETPSAATRLTGAILARHSRGPHPMRIPAAEFNRAAETYYRTGLCRLHLKNGLDTLIDDGLRLDSCGDPTIAMLKKQVLGSGPAALFIRETGHRVLSGESSGQEILALILITLLIVHLHRQETTNA